MLKSRPMEQEVEFESSGLKLSGVVHVPEDIKSGERRPAFIILHGFGSTKNAGNTVTPARMLNAWGYVVLRFDMRGCGVSEGEFGRIICLEQVADTRAAIDYMIGRADVDASQIAVMGSSFGAAVALYTGGVDERVAAVVSAGGWGNGERKFRGQHATPEAWEKFVAMLADGKAHFERTGESKIVSRYDIVPIPEHLRKNVVKNSVQEFPVDTAQSMFDFCAEEVVGNIAPRPLLLMHAAKDSVTPTEQSIELFKRAGQPTELHLLTDVDHFLLSESNVRAIEILKGWLQRFCPLPSAN